MSKGEWNAGESACWNRLRLSVSRLVDDLAYLGSVEVQERGALHRHVLLWSATPLDVLTLQRRALDAGYGCVIDLEDLPLGGSRRVEYYVSKYVTKSAGERGNVPWVRDVTDEGTGEVRRMHTVPTFRTWSSSHSWGYTLRGLRDLMRQQARARAAHLRDIEPPTSSTPNRTAGADGTTGSQPIPEAASP